VIIPGDHPRCSCDHMISDHFVDPPMITDDGTHGQTKTRVATPSSVVRLHPPISHGSGGCWEGPHSAPPAPGPTRRAGWRQRVHGLLGRTAYGWGVAPGAGVAWGSNCIVWLLSRRCDNRNAPRGPALGDFAEYGPPPCGPKGCCCRCLPPCPYVGLSFAGEVKRLVWGFCATTPSFAPRTSGALPGSRMSASDRPSLGMKCSAGPLSPPHLG